MRRLVTLMLSATLACAMPMALAACSQKADTGDDATVEETDTTEPEAEDATATDEDEAVEIAPFATLGEVFAAEGESMSSTFDEQRYVCAFNWGGSWWRVEAELPDGMYDQLNEVWTEDQDKVEELLSPLAVTKTDYTSPLDVDSIEALVGKTGADLTAQGFTFMTGGMVVNGSETDCTATLGDFDYLVTFDGTVTNEDAEDVAAAVADLTVNSVSVQGVSWEYLEG